jgi:CheY-like chemotaxis protein
MQSTSMNGLLLVDSDGVERSRLKRELEACGWVVWTASDEAAALRIIIERSGDIGAAIVDLQLPGFQGRRIMAELEQLDPEPVCVAISGKSSPTAVDAYRRISKSPLLVKPVYRAQVDALLRENWHFVIDTTEPILTGGT